MPADNLTFLIGFAAVFGALGWYLWHLEREVARLGKRLDDARAGMPGASELGAPAGSPRVAGDALTGDRGDASGAAARRAAREESHIERDAGSLPHAPAPPSHRHETEDSAAWAREESHIERDAGSLPHAPTPASHRHEGERSLDASGTGDIARGGSAHDEHGEGHAGHGHEAAVEEGATRAKRSGGEDGP